MAIDKKLLNHGLTMGQEVAMFGQIEAHRRSLVNEVAFFCETGHMRSGDFETLSNGKRLDYRTGALPAMWELLVLDYNH